MWILHPEFFLSAVQKPWDQDHGTLTIRGRVRADLERLRDRMPGCGPVIESSDSDYRYRVVAGQTAFADTMRDLVSEVSYENFKNEVAARQGYDRAKIYGRVWQELLRLETL